MLCERAKMFGMSRLTFVMVLSMAVGAVAQQQPQPDKGPGQNHAPPRSDRDKEAGESSSRDTRIDLSPPKDDAKNHPNSSAPLADVEEETAGDVREFQPWDPHKAAKDIEVGDFYFKRKNYRAALDRYREALHWKSNDAVANFRLGQCLEKLSQPDEARAHYEEYLNILPHGPLSEEAQTAVTRLQGAGEKSQATGKDQPKQ